MHARRRAAPPAAGDGRLVAPMNGRVVAVNARAGERAEAGRALVVLEAMKMEHVLSVPAAARVKAVHVAAGAQVVARAAAGRAGAVVRAHPALTAEHEALRETHAPLRRARDHAARRHLGRS